MIAGLILAAGESSRMGRDKALLPCHGQTFLENIIHTLREAGIERIAVVLGHHAEEIRQAVHLEGIEVVINSEYQRGQTSSLQAGLRALRDVQLKPAVAAASPIAGVRWTPSESRDRTSPSPAVAPIYDRRPAAGTPPLQPGEINDRLMAQERALLDERGLPGRPWFRHLIYAPRPSYEAVTLPGLREALEKGDLEMAREQAARLGAAIDRAIEAAR